MEIKQEIKIENKSLNATLIRVVLPIALQTLIACSLNLVSTLMVGNLGEIELAAVGLSLQLFYVQLGVLFGFSSGASAFMSQFWGKQDLHSLRKVAGFTVMVCFGISMLFFLPVVLYPEYVMRIFTDDTNTIGIGKDFIRIASICFLASGITLPLTAVLRTTQQTSIPLKISILVFIVNTVLNYILIFGKFGMPTLGVKGAAIATVAARVLEAILTICFIFGGKNLIGGKIGEYFGWLRPFAYKILFTAVPVMINETMWSVGMAAYNAAYGRMGVTEFAAVQAGNTINTMFILVIFSLGDAVVILVGQRIGMGQMEYAFALAKRLLRIGIIIGAIAGVLMILTSQFMVSLFNFTETGRYYTLMIIGVYGIFMPLKISNGLHIVGTLRCGGDTRFAMWVEMSSVWLIGVPIVFFGALYLALPIYYVVLLAQTEEIVKGIICHRRFYSKKWLKSLVHG